MDQISKFNGLRGLKKNLFLKQMKIMMKLDIYTQPILPVEFSLLKLKRFLVHMVVDAKPFFTEIMGLLILRVNMTLLMLSNLYKVCLSADKIYRQNGLIEKINKRDSKYKILLMNLNPQQTPYGSEIFQKMSKLRKQKKYFKVTDSAMQIYTGIMDLSNTTLFLRPKTPEINAKACP